MTFCRCTSRAGYAALLVLAGGVLLTGSSASGRGLARSGAEPVTPESEAPEGEAPEGEAPEGEGEAPEGEAPKGEAPEGEGEAPEGEAPEGEGEAPEGEGETAYEAAAERCTGPVAGKSDYEVYLDCKRARDMMKAKLEAYEEEGRGRGQKYSKLLSAYTGSQFSLVQAAERLVYNADLCQGERDYAQVVRELEMAQSSYVDNLPYSVVGFDSLTLDQQVEFQERDEFYAERKRETDRLGTFRRLADDAQLAIEKCMHSRPSMNEKSDTFDGALCKRGADEALQIKRKRQLVQYLDACDAAIDQGGDVHRLDRLVVLDALFVAVGNEMMQERAVNQSEIRAFGSEPEDCSLYAEQRGYAARSEQDAAKLLESPERDRAQVQELTLSRRRAAMNRESATALWLQCMETTRLSKPSAGAVAALVGGVGFLGIGAAVAATFPERARYKGYSYDFERLGFGLGGLVLGNFGIMVGAGALAIRHFDPIRPSSRRRVARKGWMLLASGAVTAVVGGALVGGAYGAWRSADFEDDPILSQVDGLARSSAVMFTLASGFLTSGLTYLGVATYSPNYPVTRRFKAFMNLSKHPRGTSPPS